MEEAEKYKSDQRENDIVFSKTIKAGKRIYYLDVKKNKKEELFLAITESRKLHNAGNSDQGNQFEKHKIFLYKEDFDKFTEGIAESIEYIRKHNTVNFVPEHSEPSGQQKEFIEPILGNIDLKIDF